MLTILNMPGALVRRRVASNALALASYHPYAKKARMAYTVGRTAYAHRKKLRWAAGKIGRAWRRRAAKKRAKFGTSMVGEPPGSSSAKSDLVVNLQPGFFGDRTLNVHELTEIAEGSTEDRRIRKQINLRGFKICCEFRNAQSDPMYLNVAVLAPKQSATVDTTDFFRDDGNSDDRAVNFSNLTLNSMQFHCLGINTDEYVILKHRRYRLTPAGGATEYQAASGRNYMNIDWYIPIKRQLRYQSTSGSPESGQMFLVYWCAIYGGGLTGTVSATAMERTIRTTAYFRENWSF